MTNLQRCKSAIAIAALFAASGAFAATMNKAEYKAAKNRITSDYKSEKSMCSTSSGNALDICKEQAKGKESVALAELTYSYSGKAEDGVKVSIAKVDSEYAVAKEMCDDKAGAPKDVCKAEAKAAHTKARADAKLDDSIIDAKKDARSDKLNAEYKLAAVKCETLTGQQQEACINEAKLNVNKAKQPNAGATGTVDVKYVSPTAKLESDYKLAMDKCDKLAGEQQESCVTDTKIRFNKAPRTKAQLNAKARDAATEVKVLSPAEKLEADYKIATDKCKKLSGEQHDGCISTAKQRFNKT